MHVSTCMLQCMCGSQRSTFRSWVFHFVEAGSPLFLQSCVPHPRQLAQEFLGNSHVSAYHPSTGGQDNRCLVPRPSFIHGLQGQNSGNHACMLTEQFLASALSSLKKKCLPLSPQSPPTSLPLTVLSIGASSDLALLILGQGCSLLVGYSVFWRTQGNSTAHHLPGASQTATKHD